MSILFGFAGRIGRLEYFLLTILLAVVMTALVLTLVWGLASHYPMSPGATEPPSTLIILIVAIVGPIFLWFTLALQAKRFRDMGWNPLHVLSGWIAAIVIDTFIAYSVPSLALESGDGTAIGALINLVMFGCLLFWPSMPAGSDDSYHTIPSRERPAPVVPPPARSDLFAAPAPSGFGRRRS